MGTAQAKKEPEIQEIEVGLERAVVVPLKTWRTLVARLEELEDQHAWDESLTEDDEEVIEHDELCRRLGRSPLRYLRRRAGLSQSELARRAGLSQAFIAKMESDEKKPSAASRKKLAAALGIKADQLEY